MGILLLARAIVDDLARCVIADREAPLPEPLVLVHVAVAELPRHRSSQILEPSARGGGALAGHKGHT